MKFQIRAGFTIVLLNAAVSISKEIELSDIKVASRLGNQILTEARVLEQDEYYETAWLSDYSLQFTGCNSIIQYGEGERAVYMQNLVKFRVCPADSCNKNCKGLYLVDMDRFVEAYVEYKEEALETACETTRENCYCNDDGVDDEQCESQCYIDAGLENCIEADDDDGNEFEIQRFLRCEELGDYDDDRTTRYYVGPRCSRNGKSIFLDVFEDAGCIEPAPSGTYEKFSYYGKELPYAKTSIIDSECISCKVVADGDDDNQNDDVELNEICEQTYQDAAKCERGLNIDNPQVSHCKYIKSEIMSHDVRHKSPKFAVVLSWILFVTTLALGHKVISLQNERDRSNVKLTDHEGGVVA